MAGIRLNEAERQSALWARLQEYWQGQLEVLRMKNDADLDAVESARLRGRIAQIKAFLSLDQEAPGGGKGA